MSRGRRVLTRQPLPVASLPYWWTRYISLGGDLTGPNPVDRGKSGSKIHVLFGRAEIPLAEGVSAANTNDAEALEPLVKAIPAAQAAAT